MKLVTGKEEGGKTACQVNEQREMKEGRGIIRSEMLSVNWKLGNQVT